METRIEEKRDREAVWQVNVLAFETPAEAKLVDALRETVTSAISFVAEDEGKVIGHLMLSPVELTGHPNMKLMGLAPMAVVPSEQRRGVGSALVRRGLLECQQRNYAGIVVLGHPEYYPRFGFEPASNYQLKCEYDVPDDVFMALELEESAFLGKSGTIRYHDAFCDV